MEGKAGDKLKIRLKDREIEGVLMPRSELLLDDHVVVKLESGYNIGIEKERIIGTEILVKAKEAKETPESYKADPKLPNISILHTGGTIASRVDYRTGGVVSRFSPSELLEMFPELKKIANIDSRLVFQMFSEDMEPAHWPILANECKKESDKGADGIIITHGTDTMHYTSAALTFMIQNTGIPIILVGAQRSSDRGSSDAFGNMTAAAKFIVKSDFAGVAVCMHENTDDSSYVIHSGTKARKLHTSRRDAFRSVNASPIARITEEGKIKYMKESYRRKNKTSKLTLKDRFEPKIGILKIHPGITHHDIDYFSCHKGLVIEGTGLGHAPVTTLDEHTKGHKKTLDSITALAKKIPVVMSSQCIFGSVNMNVYATGRDLIKAGMISAQDMTTETAYVKLGWAIANSRSKEEAIGLFSKNVAGEHEDRILIDEV